MATYYATNDVTVGQQDAIGKVQHAAAVWAIGSATLGTADVLVGPTVPANSMIVGVTLTASDLDTSNTLTLDVGDSGDDNRLMSAATIGTAGGSTQAMVGTSIGYTYTSATRIDVTPQAASAGGVAGGAVALEIHYIVLESTS